MKLKSVKSFAKSFTSLSREKGKKLADIVNLRKSTTNNVEKVINAAFEANKRSVFNQPLLKKRLTKQLFSIMQDEQDTHRVSFNNRIKYKLCGMKQRQSYCFRRLSRRLKIRI